MYMTRCSSVEHGHQAVTEGKKKKKMNYWCLVIYQFLFLKLMCVGVLLACMPSTTLCAWFPVPMKAKRSS